jgi:SCY1-like protein 2
MVVIHKLGERVEQEHIQFLRDSQRLEDRSATTLDGAIKKPAFGHVVDFETLVSGSNGITTKGNTAEPSGWDEDDVWGSILNPAQARPFFLSLSLLFL